MHARRAHGGRLHGGHGSAGNSLNAPGGSVSKSPSLKCFSINAQLRFARPSAGA